MPAEGRGLSSRQTQDVVRDRGLGNLSTPKSVQKLQMALHAKAKAEAGYRFYALYDKISREDILAHAYAQCRSNRGAPGVDGQDFADIEAHGVERWLGDLALALKEETYQPDPIRRVFIPKANGKLRPLGKQGRAPATRTLQARFLATSCPRRVKRSWRQSPMALAGLRAAASRPKRQCAVFWMDFATCLRPWKFSARQRGSWMHSTAGSIPWAGKTRNSKGWDALSQRSFCVAALRMCCMPETRAATGSE